MISHFINKRIKYDGFPLYSHWTYRQTGILGDSIVSFIGPCQIPPENIVDLEDLRRGNKIAGTLMLHFIIEFFDHNLEKAVLHQHLFSALVKDVLAVKTGRRLIRRGDDIYDGAAKLTISIATLTSVSTKIHFAINIESRGTPVKTRGLADYRIPPTPFAREAMTAYLREISSLAQARVKVRSVP